MIELQVFIDCEGCERNIRKSLEKLKGVDNIDIDVNLQKVTVTGSVDQKTVLKTVRRTGRRAELWQMPYNPELRNNNFVNQSYSQHHYNGPGGAYHAHQQVPSSSYNYKKHGYDNHGHGGYYGQQIIGQSSMFGSRAGDAFSDENPHGCSIM
ncbi:hypothetical protein LIER_18646 [Lithospermum erythrorhizon]|uniref:HMA domain-containing protein n=1 Tax=Lithospermum erythrorhizon TaxID=34254 RepID=A0AAV3QH41_LITER